MRLNVRCPLSAVRCLVTWSGRFFAGNNGDVGRGNYAWS